MAKGKSNAPVVMNKGKFLLPKMEFFPIDKATGEGFYLRELGGRSMLEFKELIERMKAEAGEDAELTGSQGIELMTKFVILAACDAEGSPIFTDDDLALLADKSPSLLKEISDKAMMLSGMNPEVLSEVKSNLPNDPPVSSTTD